MTLKEEISKNRASAQSDIWQDLTDKEINMIVDRIDDLAELLSRLEVKLFNISLSPPPSPEIPEIPEEVLKDAIEIFKATVAEKKRELAAKSEKEE